MLTQIKLRNFQKHHQLTINLGPVTTIVGRSRKGKSGLLRALRFACLNKPRGDRFVTRQQESPAMVILKAEDNKVVRIRGKSKNIYKLNGQVRKAFGTGKVPVDVEDALNVSDTNFQTQHDAPFLFSLTPGQVSKRLNSIVNLSSVDNALSNIASEVRRAKSELEVTEQRLKEAKQEQDELEWAVKFNEDIQDLLEAEKAHQEKTSRIACLRVLIEKATKYQARIDRASNAILCVAKLVEKGRKIAERLDELEKLKGLLAKARSYQEVLKQETPDLAELLSARGDADQASERHRELEYLLNKAKEKKKKLWQLQKKLKNSERNLPKRCPTCKRPLRSSSSGRTYTSHSKHR